MTQTLLDSSLAVIVVGLLVKETFSLVRWVLARRNGSGGHGEAATKLDLAEAKAEILHEFHQFSDAVQDRVSAIDVRIARIEGRRTA